MGKVLPKKKFFRSAIYSPKLNVGSHIDNVKYSLEHLIFSNAKESEENLLKKRITVVVIVTLLLMIVGSYLSPKGKADIATFYPTSCLGGWTNPRNAEGEPQTKSNTDESLFTKENSAILEAGVQADMYCGNFIGQIEEKTKPTKIIVTLAWSKGPNPVLEQKIVGDSFASSSAAILDSTSTGNVSFTLSSSTTATTSSVTEKATTTETIQSTTTQEVTPPVGVASTTPSAKTSVIDTVIGALGGLFGSTSATTSVSTSETVGATTTGSSPVTPPASSTPPVSFFDSSFKKLASRFVQTVSAQEVAATSSLQETSQASVITTTSTKELPPSIDMNSTTTGTSSALVVASSTSLASSTDATSTATASSDILLSGNPEDDAPNNFLEVLYTLDGTVWKSMGKVNEASMKYRTFEIPITATTSWEDISGLQIKVRPLQRIDVTPAVYLDGIKMEVLYETPVVHPHPDFARDTILQDKSDDGVRIVNILNSDTNTNEIWYTTLTEQGEYGVAPGSWVQVQSEKSMLPYKLIDIYGQNLFLLDESQKLLWVRNLQKETNDGIGLVVKGTTTAQFMKSNGEQWIFEYNYVTKKAVVRIKN